MCLHVWCLEEIQELLDKRWQVVCTTVVATIQLVEVTFMYVTVCLSNSQKIQGQSTMRLLVK